MQWSTKTYVAGTCAPNDQIQCCLTNKIISYVYTSFIIAKDTLISIFREKEGCRLLFTPK